MRLLNEFIGLVSISSALPAIIIGTQSKSVLWLYCCLSAGADIMGYAFWKMEIHRFWVSNLFIAGEWILISNFLIRNTCPPKHQRAVHIGAYFLGAIFIARTIYFSPFVLNYGDAAILFELYVIGTLFGLYKVIRKIEFLQIEQSPLFIFCASFLLYVSGSLIMLLVKKHLDKSDADLMRNLWVIHNILNIVKNLSIGYCLILLKRQEN